MGFWSSLMGSRRKDGESEPTDDAPAREAATAEEAPPPKPTSRLRPGVQRLITFGAADGPSEPEALALLREARASSEEGVALDALAQRHRESRLPEALAIAVASALIDRGDRTSALALLDGLHQHGAGSLMMRADLLAEDGDFAGAIAAIERVLVRDVDLPGAAERRRSFRQRLGIAEATHPAYPAMMTIASPHARAPFDLVREVARGGAGVVFEAKDRELGRTVALKLYHQPERDRAQLLSEGRVAAALEGAGVVRVFDVEPTEGWLALEWATHGALRDALRPKEGGPDPLGGHLETILAGLLSALARVHAQGWVHHDVKPANVLVSVEGAAGVVAWLADFGSARRRGEPSPPGSMGYVSPERLAGRASDPRDDVYGFGRVVEDVLAVRGAELPAAWHAVASVCVGPSEARPADASAVVLPEATR
jgi:serine/threonine-protein kinase